MIRRMQLLGPEPRFPVTRVAALGDRVREGLLHDNKVLPAVLGVLALLIFAWLIAGALTGGPGGEEEQQASSKASLAQAPDNNSDSGNSETPSPGADNRDTDSYAAFKAKDPFKLPNGIGPKAAGKATNESTTTGGSSRESTSSSRSDGGSGGGSSGSRSGEQSSSRGASSSGNGGGGRGTGSNNAGGGADGGGTGQGGNGDLFNSGGDLPVP